ncbi:MAG: hypothetical protein IJV28_01035 [Paludibacteraceae bacterium]|nr:hypothetical protein [Paludibacteraceae bacterium]
MDEAENAGWQPAQRKNLNGGKNATERNYPHTMRDNRRNGQTKRNGQNRESQNKTGRIRIF